MFYELLQQGPAVYIPAFLFSFVITVAAYGAFPLIMAKTQKKIITKRKYNVLCFFTNFFVMAIFVAVNGNSASGGPYILWTWFFSSIGIKILKNRGVLSGVKPVDCAKTATISEGTATNTGTTEVISTEKDSAVMPEVKPDIRFCRKCGFELISGSAFCSRCGTKVIRG